MANLRIPVVLFSLLFVALFTSSCGSNTPRELQSITVSPAVADAQSYPGGQVQFSATGNYNTSPQMMTSQSVTWGTCYQNAPTSGVSVTAGGLAQCVSGATGTYMIWANAPASSNVTCQAMNACGGGCFVVGSAQLTCP